jgi:hypothetical protein
MADRGHGDARKDVVMGGKGAKNTGANPAHVNGGVKTVEVAAAGLSSGRMGGGRREFAGQVTLQSDYHVAVTHPSHHN